MAINDNVISKREYNHKYYLDNKERFNVDRKNYVKQYIQDIVLHYGDKCALCESTENLTIDHKYGGGRRHCAEHGLGKGGGYNFYLWLKRNDYPLGYTVDGIYYPDGFRVLCVHCNNIQPRLSPHILLIRRRK